MLSYRLPQFMSYLDINYNALYKHYVGRLIELFPSFSAADNNLVIAHDANDEPEEDEYLMRLWKRFLHDGD